jgi:D-glycero-D-manno-heptose 1,7-bisphosphate phosphatase
MSGRIAAFLDRDGTIIRDANYVADPKDVSLLPGAAAAIRRLNDRDIPVIVVTNQSGIARRYLTAEQYETVRHRVDELLNAEDARITRTYMCPHYPDITGPCDCRKPGIALYQQALTEFDLVARGSLFCGDRWRDVAPGLELGGQPILLDVDSTPADDLARGVKAGVPTARSLADAVEQYLATLPPHTRKQ